jgi:small-conductance mechanosensitive channel
MTIAWPLQQPGHGAVAAAVVALVLLWTLRAFARRALGALAARSESRLDDELVRGATEVHGAVLVALAAWAGYAWAGPDVFGYGMAAVLGRLALLAHVGVWTSGVIRHIAQERASQLATEGQQSAAAWRMVATVARVTVWSILGLVALDAAGVDITGLIAGLGVGGIAVGLALQNVVGDLFASLSIVVDKPFVVGDFVVLDDISGTVEHVGWKTTRIRSLSGEQVVLGNADVLSGRVRNFRRMSERRVLVTFGVVYDTPADALEAIPARVRAVVERQPGARFERGHLARLGESSLDFELVYHVLDPDYGRHMDVQQAILLGLIRTLEGMAVGFAFPTRTLHVVAATPAAGARTEALPGSGRVVALDDAHVRSQKAERDAELGGV